MQEINELIQTETPAIVGETLDFMLYECSLDEAPAAEDVARWRDILRARGGKFLRLADLCQTWLDGAGARRCRATNTPCLPPPGMAFYGPPWCAKAADTRRRLFRISTKPPTARLSSPNSGSPRVPGWKTAAVRPICRWPPPRCFWLPPRKRRRRGLPPTAAATCSTHWPTLPAPPSRCCSRGRFTATGAVCKTGRLKRQNGGLNRLILRQFVQFRLQNQPVIRAQHIFPVFQILCVPRKKTV